MALACGKHAPRVPFEFADDAGLLQLDDGSAPDDEWAWLPVAIVVVVVCVVVVSYVWRGAWFV
jgi:hypothetical protein